MRRNGGFTAIEVIIGLVVVAVMTFAFYRLYLSFKAQESVYFEREALEKFRRGIYLNYVRILEVFEGICSQIDARFADDSWGWRHPNCLSTSPLPAYVNGNLVYYIDFSSLIPTEAQALAGYIEENLYPLCVLESSDSASLSFSCITENVRVTNIYYVTPYSGNVHVSHTPGFLLDFLNFPTELVIEYDFKISGTEEVISGRVYRIGLGELYAYSVRRTEEKLSEIVRALRTYAQTRIVQEFNNVFPNGLPEFDDFFVPWHWQVLGNGIYVECTDSNCSAIDTSVWPSGRTVTGFAYVWTRVVSNLLGGDMRYVVDGFGNPWRLILISNGCGVDLSFCPANNGAPPLPQQNYRNVYTLRPPYVSVIVSPLCLSGRDPFVGRPVPEFCREEIVYGN